MVHAIYLHDESPAKRPISKADRSMPFKVPETVNAIMLLLIWRSYKI